MTVRRTPVNPWPWSVAMAFDYGLLAERFAAAGVRPTATPVGVTRPAFPELLVELEATAVE